MFVPDPAHHTGRHALSSGMHWLMSGAAGQAPMAKHARTHTHTRRACNSSKFTYFAQYDSPNTQRASTQLTPTRSAHQAAALMGAHQSSR